MKKSKMNFAQKFIIIALVLILIVSGIVIYGVYDYYNVEVVNNRQEGQIYDVKDVSEEQMLSMFAKRFNPYLPKINEDTQFTSISNPQKDVTATSGFESYTIINVYDNFYTNYGQIGLTKEDVRGYDNREYHAIREYYLDYPLGIDISLIATPEELNVIDETDMEYMYTQRMGILYMDGLRPSYFENTSLYSKNSVISVASTSFVSYSAYSQRMDRYELGDQLYSGDKNVITQLGEIDVNGIKVEMALSERETGEKERLLEAKNEFILKSKATMVNGRTEYDALNEAFGRSVEEVYDDAIDGGNEMILTLVRGRFRVDGIYYEIVYPLINRWYNTESNNIGAQSTDYQKLSAVATKSMTYLVADFIK